MSGSAPANAHRIGYVAKVFPRLSETFVINEVRELERLGIDVHVFSLHAPPSAVPHGALRDLRAAITCIERREEPSKNDREAASARLLALFADEASLGDRLFPRHYVRLAVQLAAAAQGLGLSRFHAHFASRAAHVAMLASRLTGIPYSMTAHAKDIYHQEVDLELLRVKMRHADIVVTVSDFNRRTLLRIGSGIPHLEAKLRRLYNGVDLALFHPGPAVNGAALRILAVGRFVEKKGFPVLIEACGVLRQRGVPFTCDLIGSGTQQALLEDLIARRGLGGQITVRGALALEEVAREMRAASLLVLPCITAADGNMDALPTVLLEAMASGVPVVSTALSGIPEIVVDGETGYLVEPGDAVALAGAMEKILREPESSARLGRAGRRRAEELFDLHANVALLGRWLTEE